MSPRELHEIFEKRASNWEKNGGESGKIIAAEIRTLNKEWLELIQSGTWAIKPEYFWRVYGQGKRLKNVT